jgi:hypothetical protein
MLIVPNVFLTFLTENKISNINTGVGYNIFRKTYNFYKIKKIGMGQFVRGGRGW